MFSRRHLLPHLLCSTKGDRSWVRFAPVWRECGLPQSGGSVVCPSLEGVWFAPVWRECGLSQSGGSVVCPSLEGVWFAPVWRECVGLVPHLVAHLDRAGGGGGGGGGGEGGGGGGIG